MTTRVGVGTSLSRDGHEAGHEAAEQAFATLGGEPASLVVVLATAGYSQQPLIDSVSEVFPNVPMAGCSAEGIITRKLNAESSHAVAVLAVASDELRFSTFVLPRYADESARSGTDLGVAIRRREPNAKLVVLLSDGIRGNATEFIRSLEAALPHPVTVVGGAAGDLLNFSRTYQYHDGTVYSGSMVALVATGEFETEVAVTHGCELVGTPRTITRAEGGFVYSIDDQPAWDLFRPYLDSPSEGLDALHVAHVLLAEHLPVAPTKLLDDFTVRAPVRLDKDTGALYFVAGLKSGTHVQIALRNADKVCDRAIAAAHDIATRRPRDKPLLVLQWDCAYRGRLLLGEGVQDRLLVPMRREFDADVPWFGMNTYGEIGPIGERTYFHNYTVVLCALYPTRSARR